jgi:hypothetical protein
MAHSLRPASLPSTSTSHKPLYKNLPHPSPHLHTWHILIPPAFLYAAPKKGRGKKATAAWDSDVARWRLLKENVVHALLQLLLADLPRLLGSKSATSRVAELCVMVVRGGAAAPAARGWLTMLQAWCT